MGPQTEGSGRPSPGRWAPSSQLKVCTERLRNGGARLPGRWAGTPVSRASAGQETPARRESRARPRLSGGAHTPGGSVFRLAPASGSRSVSGRLGGRGAAPGGTWPVWGYDSGKGAADGHAGTPLVPRAVALIPRSTSAERKRGLLWTVNRESRNTQRWHLHLSAGTRARVSARPSEPGDSARSRRSAPEPALPLARPPAPASHRHLG